MFTLPENPYAILDVAKNAQIPEIRLAYRKLVLKCHPDKVTDPAQKAIKVEEFQKVQKAYEILSDENERQKYDDMVRANELEKENAERRRQRDREATPGRTPPRSYDSDYGRSPQFTVHVKHETPYRTRTAEPPLKKSQTWSAGSPYTSTRTPPRSFEEMPQYTTYTAEPRESRESRDSRRSKKASFPDEKIPSRHEDDRRSRKKEEENARMQEKIDRARRKQEEAMREAEEKERQRKEKERRKEEKRKAEKVRDSERRRDAEEKRTRHKNVYVEEDSDTPPPATPITKEKKSKSSSRSKETPAQSREIREPRTEDKHDHQYAFAKTYLEASGKTHRVQTYSSTLPPVQTPPPAHHGVAPPPPPMANMAEKLFSEEDEEPVPRSAARRRMSNDSPRVRDKVSSSYKKSREPEYMAEPIRPSPPKMHRAHTEYPAPGVSPSFARTTTWNGDEFRARRDYFDEGSDDDARYQSRRGRRARSPENMTFTYKVDANNRTTQPKVRTMYADEPPSTRRSGRSSSHYAEANMGRPLEHRPTMPPSHSFSGQQFYRVKQSKTYDSADVQYSPHAPQIYNTREPYAGVAS
ncbi:hypothetical protein PFICI_11191 [Pestalotiopsis fici W106-1]|uniref:J domain-containing protein n=1 Tax=Pestalotiopsis fici (strain W106-1 / CGMCC3.15140) TaxID=1229662 RepID=W3WW31_PESFW|nr:uncharacterized protein PFICI_11191 [Pestalotiopsis fici W106-1]ETS77317.1 hypothetical protein PFICI_11191 [Pestalotiopsis fici W106-1]